MRLKSLVIKSFPTTPTSIYVGLQILIGHVVDRLPQVVQLFGGDAVLVKFMLYITHSLYLLHAIYNIKTLIWGQNTDSSRSINKKKQAIKAVSRT